MEIRSDSYQLQIIDDPSYTIGSADNHRRYDHEYSFSREPISRHGIVCFDEHETRHSCIVMASRGATGIHEHSAVIVRDQCFVAVGDQLCCLSLPELHLIWSAKVDFATCFGVHYSAAHDSMISHGEVEIAKLDFNGKILWTVGGKDIFTGNLRLDEKYIYVTDFNNELYRIEIGTGKSEIITP
jgi:hypothetical protein